MRTHQQIKNTIRNVANFDYPHEAAEITVLEIKELARSATPSPDAFIDVIENAFHYGFICGSRWSKKNPAATLERHDGKHPKK